MEPGNIDNTIITEIIPGILSYDEEEYKSVLESFFTVDAVLTHPILNVQGRHNIRKVFQVWTLLNKKPPKVTNTEHFVCNENTAVINVTQYLCPRIFPFLHFAVPSVTILRFREEKDGFYYIYKQEDNWTLEGLINSVPLINWWYENVVRVYVGHMVMNVGSFLATANQATSRLTIAANDIRQHSGEAMTQGQDRAYKYGHDLANNVSSVISKTKKSIGIKGSENQQHYYMTNGEARPEN
ncbi:6465_t:CDS:2 [Funneliformis geosporum]|uniref:3829_t:CDS:1 n=1 Tax=Funneliformis geosporum TaxID=1117311 RepID=A0A9W4X0A2_9GLOM|nr:3829_t:CDS:2 [Funneliformis geosporum]CAI2178573.1 6465_t:CDS:2 [Funneliformis geosporum]